MSRMADERDHRAHARGADRATRDRAAARSRNRAPTRIATRCRSSTTRASPTARTAPQERSRLIAVVETPARSNLTRRRARARADRRRHVRLVRAVRQARSTRIDWKRVPGRCSASTASRSGDDVSDASVPRVLLVVCDSWGVGDAPDAAAYGDAGRRHARQHVARGGRPSRAEPGGARARAPHRDRGRRSTRRRWIRPRPRHRAIGRQGHDDRALGDDGDPARASRSRCTPTGSRPRSSSRSRRRSAGGSWATIPASGTEIIAELGERARPHRASPSSTRAATPCSRSRPTRTSCRWRRCTSGAASRDGCSPASTPSAG